MTTRLLHLHWLGRHSSAASWPSPAITGSVWRQTRHHIAVASVANDTTEGARCDHAAKTAGTFANQRRFLRQPDREERLRSQSAAAVHQQPGIARSEIRDKRAREDDVNTRPSSTVNSRPPMSSSQYRSEKPVLSREVIGSAGFTAHARRDIP